MREVDLISPLVKTYIDKGYRAYAEVKLSSRWIDVFLINDETEETIAVELKLSKWKKAYQQAKVYQMVADYVYVGMPEEFVHRAVENKKYFEELGIGILSINGKANTAIEARKSNLVMSTVKKDIIKSLDPNMEVILDENGNLTKTFYPCGRIQ